MSGIDLNALIKNDENNLPSGVSNIQIDESLIDKEEEKSLLDKIKSFPSAVKEAFTGENAEIEFPEVPAIADLGDYDSDAPGFFEDLIPSIKTIMVRDDRGKAEIIARSYKDDSRFGGVFEDKFGLPLIMWNEKPYYINKPGMTTVDLSTALGELIKFLPATKLIGTGTTLNRASKAIPLTGGTEVLSQVLESQLTPETTKAKTQSGERTTSSIAQDVGLSTAIGVGAEIALPVVGGGVRRAAQSLGKVSPQVVKNIFPKLNPEIVSKSKYPLTQGQSANKPFDYSAGSAKQTQAGSQLKKEDIIRYSDQTGSDILTKFDERQMDLIRQDAKALQEEFGSGTFGQTASGEVPTEASRRIQDIILGESDQLKSTASKGYKAVKEAVDQPVFTREGFNKTAQGALDEVFEELGVNDRLLNRMPILKDEVEYLRKIIKATQNTKRKAIPFKAIAAYQKSINLSARQAAPGSTEALALGSIKRKLDDAVFNGIEQGFITGDKEVIDTLFKAKEAYKQYIGLTGKGTARQRADRAANNILQKISDPELDAPAFVNKLFGHSKFNPSDEMVKIIKRFKANLPPEKYDEVISLIKDGVIEKAFSGQGKRITRANVINNYSDVFINNRKLINELFSPEELLRIKDFRQNVIPTMWADPSMMLNASGSSYGLLSAGNLFGIMSFAGKIPFVQSAARGVADEIVTRQSINQARNATRQYIIRKAQPLSTATVDTSAAVLRGPVIEGSVNDSTALSGIFEEIDDQTRRKILDAANVN